jgi:hypothetical protein
MMRFAKETWNRELGVAVCTRQLEIDARHLLLRNWTMKRWQTVAQPVPVLSALGDLLGRPAPLQHLQVRVLDYARTAAGRGIEVIIAGAGGAAHLPGMVASATLLPVIGQ